MSSALIEVRNLTKAFPVRGGLFGTRRGSVQAVNAVSFRVEPGEVFGLAGESGSGKSTIARMILGLAQPSAGEILFDGQNFAAERDMRRRSRAVQMVFQNPGSSLNPRRSIGQSIATPLDAQGVGRIEARRRVAELLEQVQLPGHFAERYPFELSGGQKQRAAIARALAAGPRLVVLDEPTSALDVSVQAKIIELLDDLRTRLGLTYIFISHDLSLMRNFANRVGVLYLGRLIESGPARDLFEAPAHPYTRALISSVPVASEEEERLKPHEPPIEGEIPNPANMPAGCPFHPRCPYAFAPCAVDMPPAYAASAGHYAHCHQLRPAAEAAAQSRTSEETPQ